MDAVLDHSNGYSRSYNKHAPRVRTDQTNYRLLYSKSPRSGGSSGTGVPLPTIYIYTYLFLIKVTAMRESRSRDGLPQYITIQ